MPRPSRSGNHETLSSLDDANDRPPDRADRPSMCRLGLCPEFRCDRVFLTAPITSRRRPPKTPSHLPQQPCTSNRECRRGDRNGSRANPWRRQALCQPDFPSLRHAVYAGSSKRRASLSALRGGGGCRRRRGSGWSPDRLPAPAASPATPTAALADGRPARDASSVARRYRHRPQGCELSTRGTCRRTCIHHAEGWGDEAGIVG